MNWKTVREWEEENKSEYPWWAAVWTYDAYGECWETALWKERKDFYEHERNEPKMDNPPAWMFYYEPMVCDPNLPAPKWGDGVGLRKNIPCQKCGQTVDGQSGEYPCKSCGVPVLHDS